MGLSPVRFRPMSHGGGSALSTTFAYAKNTDADEPLEMKVKVGTVTNLTVTASTEGDGVWRGR